MASFTLFVGALVAAGGGIGYIKAKSVPSLTAGLGFGTAFAVCAYLMNSGNPILGHKLALLFSMILAFTMGRRFLATQKVMPAGVIAAVGVISTFYHIGYVM